MSEKPDGDWIPRERYNTLKGKYENAAEEVTKWRQAAEQATTAATGYKGRLEELQAQVPKIEELKQQLANAEASHSADLEMAAVGITDKMTMEFIKAQHAQSDTEKFGDYLGALKENPPTFLESVFKPSEPEAGVAEPPAQPTEQQQPGQPQQPATTLRKLPGNEGNPQDPGAPLALDPDCSDEEFEAWEASGGLEQVSKAF